MVIAFYLNVPAVDIGPTERSQGKPELVSGFHAKDLLFNVARSGNLLLIAIANGQDVGVDVEDRHATFNAMSIARQFFSAEECNTLARPSVADQEQVFLRLWTRKEALIKAGGRGMKIVKKVRPRPDAILPKGETILIDGRDFACSDISLGDAYQGTVAVAGPSIGVGSLRALRIP